MGDRYPHPRHTDHDEVEHWAAVLCELWQWKEPTPPPDRRRRKVRPDPMRELLDALDAGEPIEGPVMRVLGAVTLWPWAPAFTALERLRHAVMWAPHHREMTRR